MKKERETGKYYIKGLSSKSLKRIYSKNFKNTKDAIKEAIKRQKKGKIMQANIIFTKNLLSDVVEWKLDTKGKVKKFN